MQRPVAATTHPARRRSAARVAWSICVVALTLTAAGLVLLVLTLSHPGAQLFDYWVENTMVAVGFSIVGAVITPRSWPPNPIGWILGTLGIVAGVRLFSAEYAVQSLVAAPGSLPGGELFAWITTWVWVPHIGLLVVMALRFPNGRFASSRWQWVGWVNRVLVAAGVGLAAFATGPVFGLESIDNPYAIDGLGNFDQLIEALIYTFGIAAASSLVVRMRRATGIERQQLKWFVYALTVGISGAVFGYVLAPAPSTSWLGVAGFVLIMVSILGMPVAIGFAILRYRLYDIDRLINRTIVYGLLTTLLGVAYAGVVLLLGQLFGDVGHEPPSWAVAGATLAVAAVFQPARRRVQRAVNRRFNRGSYDAARTIQDFSDRLRHEIDLPTLSGELLSVVDQTMQPTSASLWLRPGFRAGGRTGGVDRG
jgi:hypothetical protein